MITHNNTPIKNEKVVTVLLAHYRDTYSIIKDLIRLRNKMLLFSVILIAIQFLQISDPGLASDTAMSLFKIKFGFEVSVNRQVIAAILWLALLICVMRYFQIHILMERLYRYLHKTENKFTSFLGDHLIDREGKNYFDNYPVFSVWIHVIYTWIFPILLLLVTGDKIVCDFPGWANCKIPYIVSVIFCVSIWVSTVLYLVTVHRKKITL